LAAFFLLTPVFFPDDFFRDADFREVAVLREERALLRCLLAAFFAGISYSCRFEKNAELYMA
ncbi:MAG: hypothetical protein ACRDGA_09505, partial [Bacteroidota bacterium]